MVEKPVLTAEVIESQSVLELPQRDMLSQPLIDLSGLRVGVSVCANVIGDNPNFHNCGVNQSP